MSLFHPSCQIFVYVIVHNIPLLFFWAWRFSGNVPCFIPDTGHLYFLFFFFFLVSLARDLSILLIFPKNHLFVFVVFSIISLFLTFPFSTWLDLFCSFLGSLVESLTHLVLKFPSWHYLFMSSKFWYIIFSLPFSSSYF